MTLARTFLGLLLIFSIVMVGPSCARDDTSSGQSSSLEQQQEGSPIKWLGFNDGLDKARSEKKQIFVEFYTDWCPYCKMFQKETIGDDKVARMLEENFVYVRLNGEDSNNHVNYNGKTLSNVELANSFSVSAFPSLLFLDSGGKPITMLSGFIPPDQFEPVLAYIQQECYQTQITFGEFAKKRACN